MMQPCPIHLHVISLVPHLVQQAPELTPGSGWHSDYPYGHARNMFSAGINLGIQVRR